MEKNITIGDKYKPTLEITDQSEADRYFEECVKHCMSFGADRHEAEKIERANIGYFAGYGSSENRERVERLFHCAHPIFGAIAEHGAPSPDAAMMAGVRAAKRI